MFGGQHFSLRTQEPGISRRRGLSFKIRPNRDSVLMAFMAHWIQTWWNEEAE